MDTRAKSNKLSKQIIAAGLEVHKHLGPGLLESAYQAALSQEFALRGIPFISEFPLPFEYKGKRVDAGYRIDFLVENLVVVELKSVEKLAPIHEAQLLTYLKLSGHWLGLLLNFNCLLLKQGIRRIVNGDPD